MPYQKKRKIYSEGDGKNRYYSISKRLKDEKKISDEFEVMLSGLLLEEVIGLKLELAAKSAGGALYGIPIWHSLNDIVNDAILKYTYSATRTKKEAARFIGLTIDDFKKMLRKYEIEKKEEENMSETEHNTSYLDK